MAIFSAAVLSLAVAALPAVAPAPDPSPQPLREIGRVRAVTAFCKSILTPAASAVELALDNTARLEGVVGSLRRLDFDGNVLVKFRSTKELTRQFVELRKAAVDGQHEVDRLREAAKAANREQAAELKQFGDALAGALFRQRKLADNLGSFIAFLDASQPDPDAFLEMLPFFKERLRLTSQAREAADQFAERIAPVLEDEDRAAAHVTVFTACRGEPD